MGNFRKHYFSFCAYIIISVTVKTLHFQETYTKCFSTSVHTVLVAKEKHKTIIYNC